MKTDPRSPGVPGLVGSPARALPILLLGLGCAGQGAHRPADARPAGPVKLIFDTDMDTDVDDVGAAALLHALADNGEIEILATPVSSVYPASAPCMAAINTYYGRPALPVGGPKGRAAGIERGSRYAGLIAAEYPHALPADAVPDAVDVYRRVLAAQPDGSVVIVTVGDLTNLRDLLKSGPDEHSPLPGRELVVRKVREVSVMGGRIPRDRGSYPSGNFRPDPDATAYVVPSWPTPIMFSGDEIGEKIWTGKRVRSELPPDHLLRRAYDVYLTAEGKPERPSWDQAAVLYAARGTRDYWTVHRGGHNAIVEHGNNEWRAEPHNPNHAYLVERMPPEELSVIIEDLMMRARRAEP